MLALLLLSPLLARASTLELVQERDNLLCGVAVDRPGLALRRAEGWSGFDVDFCRAFAAATLLDADKVELVPLGGNDRLQALVAGRVDVVARHPSGAVGLDPDRMTAFAAFTLWDGQAFLVPSERRLSNARELGGTRICAAGHDATPLAEFLQTAGLAATVVGSEGFAESGAAYLNGTCDALTGGRLALASLRSQSGQADAHEILPDNISKVLMGPFVRADDPKWLDVIRWTVFALIEAEERAVTAANAEEVRESSRTARCCACSVSKASSARPWGWSRSGPSRPSGRSVITGKSTCATWVRDRTSSSSVGPTRFGSTAACFRRCPFSSRHLGKRPLSRGSSISRLTCLYGLKPRR